MEAAKTSKGDREGTVRHRENQDRGVFQKPEEDSVSRREQVLCPMLLSAPGEGDRDPATGFSNPEVLGILKSTIQVSGGHRMTTVGSRESKRRGIGDRQSR